MAKSKKQLRREAEEMDNVELTKKFVHAQGQYKPAKRRFEVLKEQMRERFDFGVHAVGGYAVEIEEKSRRYPDWGKMKEDGIFQEYSNEKTWKGLTVEKIE